MLLRSRWILHAVFPAILFLAYGSQTARSQDVRPNIPEVVTRSGLPHFLEKVKTDQTVRVAYLGGSITAAEGWRPFSFEWLKSQFPQAHLEEINATVSGTGSTLGAYRLEEDVLRHSPDLLFVEFAVNDKEDSPAAIERAMEGIVRKTWRRNPQTDICFVYTLSAGDVTQIQGGHLTQTSAAMEVIANHYGIPSINFGVEVAARIAAGKLVFVQAQNAPEPQVPVFSSDGVHPYPETGHRIYLDVFARSFLAIENVADKRPAALSAPLHVDNLEGAHQIVLAEIQKSGGWHTVSLHDDSETLPRVLPTVWEAASASESLSFRFRGDQFGLLGVKGPDVGNFSIQIDDRPPIVASLFDPYSTAGRYRIRPWISPQLSQGDHAVTVRLLGTAPDKMKILGAKANGSAADFQGTALYLGSVLIDGQIVTSK